ncbi:MAG: LptF/LptG family permease [Thermoguttaceae bacterium]|nr:LptF/LptG family permease [Thermoguttaceae bacterium]
MTILTRYVLKNIFLIFVISVLVLTIGFGLIFITRIVMAFGTPLGIAVAMFPYVLPEVFSMIIPLAALCAVCPVFSKMAACGEFIALKSAGIPPWKALLPAWVFVLILSFVMVWINDLSLSWGRKEMTRVLFSGMQTLVIGKIADEGKFAMPNGSITIEAGSVDETGQLHDAYFHFAKQDVRGTAASATLAIDYKRDPPVFGVSLVNAQFENGKTGVYFPEKVFFEFTPEKFSNVLLHADPSMAKIPEELEKLERSRQEFRQKLASRLTFGCITGDFSAIQDTNLAEREGFERQLDFRRNRYRLIIPRYWANGFTCFFFVWVGAPFAIRLKLDDFFGSFFICFISILLIYYPLMIFSFQGVKNGTFHPLFAWTGNVVMFIIGCVLLKQIHRH